MICLGLTALQLSCIADVGFGAFGFRALGRYLGVTWLWFRSFGSGD